MEKEKEIKEIIREMEEEEKQTLDFTQWQNRFNLLKRILNETPM